MKRAVDCVVVGHNELPFSELERTIGAYGKDSEAYRDLRLSAVTIGDRMLSYVDLLNYVYTQAHGTGHPAEEFRSGDIPHLAAAYLTNYLIRRGHSAAYISLFQADQALLADLLAGNPLCVAITTTLYVLNQPAIEVIQFIREHNPGTKIVIGGPLIANHARNYAGDDPNAVPAAFESALRELGADIYVIEGQGEHTLSMIVACLAEGGDLGSVPNLAYFDAGQLRRTPVQREDSAMDENYIDWRLPSTRPLGATIQTRTARSCAFKCSFCNYPTRAGKLALSSVDTIERELDGLAEVGGVRNVVFIDDTFNVPLDRFKNICRMLIRRNYGFNWFSYLRCGNADAEAFDLMAASGCKGVFLGLESGSPAILKNMNKAATVQQYADGIKRLRELDILTFASFIVGFPGETTDTLAETERFIRQHRPDYYRAQLWYCEPGTPIQQQRGKFGIAGEAFNWVHDTMESLEAIDHIERLFLTVKESTWLPQWSFDFWILPALYGRGLSFPQIRQFVQSANQLLTYDIAAVPPGEKRGHQERWLTEAVALVRGFSTTPVGGAISHV